MPLTPIEILYYTALLDQIDEAAPVATLLNNSLNIDITYDRTNAGEYRAIITGLANKFPNQRTAAYIAPGPGYGTFTGISKANEHQYNITTGFLGLGGQDNLLTQRLFEIRVYLDNPIPKP